MGEEGKEKKQKKKHKHKHPTREDDDSDDDTPLHRFHNGTGHQKQQQRQQNGASKLTAGAAAKKKGAESTSEAHFKPSSDVKGIRFGGQFIVKSFTVRRAAPMELLRLLDVPMPPPAPVANKQPQQQQEPPQQPTNQQPQPQPQSQQVPFPSATAYIPTNFTILAHHAWHTLTLGLGTKKSKVVLFVFESEAMKQAVDRLWPALLPLGDVNRRLVRGLSGCEMARFKFRKGALTFYVYAARRLGAAGFARADDLRRLLESVVALNDFLDHTAMLALPTQRSITFSSQQQPVGMAH